MSPKAQFKLGQWIYKAARVNPKKWRCYIEGEATLVIENGTEGGDKTVVRKSNISEGKQGRTAREQAEFEAESRYRKKIDKGYKNVIPTEKHVTNALGFISPQLAVPSPSAFALPKDQVVYKIQPKLDGHRAMIRIPEQGDVSMFSRGGKPIDTMEHVLEIINRGRHAFKDLDGDVYLDGELYVHGKPLQEIGSLIRRQQEGSVLVQFWCYDLVWSGDLEASYASRELRLTTQFDQLNLPFVQEPEEAHKSSVVGLDTMEILEESEIYTASAAYEDAGYEGAILRDVNAAYKPGKRNSGLIKIKNFDDSEHEVIDVFEGKPFRVNGKNIPIACFKLRTPDGKEFEALAPGTVEEKSLPLQQKDKWIGSQVTVKHKGLTEDGIPWHPVVLRLREDV